MNSPIKTFRRIFQRHEEIAIVTAFNKRSISESGKFLREFRIKVENGELVKKGFHPSGGS